MRFATAINCMDGRVQIPVIHFLQKRFDVEYVDVVTEPGPSLILAQKANAHLVASIFDRVRISIERHRSVGIAVVGHHDCAGNPSPQEEQVTHIEAAVEFVHRQCNGMQTIGLWVDENWQAHEVCQRMGRSQC